MEHRDTGRAAQQEAQQRGQQTGQQAQQRGAEARRAVPEARRSEETRRGVGMGAAAETGWLVYAGAVLVVLGLLQLIWGITGVVNNGFFIVTASGLAVAFNYMAWGWIHVALAVLLVCTGLAVLARQSWARYVGIALAALALFANFLTLAAFPIWSIVMIAVDLIAIYALAVHGRDMEPARA